MSSVEHKPGEIVALGGVYWVIHYQHRVRHRVFLESGTLFPLCRRCSEKVRFEFAVESRLREELEIIYQDIDFSVRAAHSY
jgi:hypothetical protein